MGPFMWNHWLTWWRDLAGRAGSQAMPRRRRGSLRPCLEALEDRTVPSGTDYWTGLGSPQNNDPNWSNPGNWSSGVPQDGDTLVFDLNHSHESTSTVDAGFTAANVTLVIDAWSGELNLTHSLTLIGNSECSTQLGRGYDINVAGNTLTNDGTLTLNLSAGAIDFSLHANDFFEGGNDVNLGGALVNRGTIVQEGGDQLELADRVQIQNQAGATYDFAADGGITEGVNGQAMTNAGTVEKTGGTGTSVIDVQFSNLGGTLAADSGTLQLGTTDAGGASTGGTFDAAQGAVLDFTGGGNDTTNNVFSGSYTGSGLGTVLISRALLIGTGGATFDFPPGLLQWGTNNTSPERH